MKIVDESGASRFRRVIPTAPNHPTATLDAIEATLQSAPDFDAVGVGVAGNVEDGVLTGSGNLPGWTGCHFEQAFAHLTGRPSVVLNDCAAAALGEYSSLQSELVYVIWGTGVGAASVRVVDGVALNQQHRLEQLQELTVRLVAPAQSPKLLLAAHGDGSGLVGATYAARQLLS